jgi:hypothetical protein
MNEMGLPFYPFQILLKEEKAYFCNPFPGRAYTPL